MNKKQFINKNKGITRKIKKKQKDQIHKNKNNK